MKLCFSTLACPAWPINQILDCAAENRLGVDFRGIGPAIDITTLAEFGLERLATTLSPFRERGVALPCLNTSITLLAPAEKWPLMLDECQRTLRVAVVSGTGLFRIFGGRIPESVTRDEAASLARRRLRQLVKIGKSIAPACKPVLETHDDWSTSDQVLGIIGGFANDEVGALWDIEHPYRKGELPNATVAALGAARIAHVHVKDSVRTGGKNSPRLLGAGELPIAECVAELRAIDYTGWYCLETEKRWHAEAPEPSESIPQFAGFMRKL